MNPKITSILEKISKEKSRGSYAKALQRTAAAIEEYPLEQELYREAIGLGLEAGEPLQAIKYFKRAQGRFAADRNAFYDFAAALEKKTCDPVFGKYLLEHSIKNKNLLNGFRIAQSINDHMLEDLLLRIRKKRETLSSALRGGHNLNSEIAINETSEAILHLALGNMREAVQIFTQHMDSNALPCEMYETLLTDLEKLHPRDGYIRYALGSCYLSRQDIDKGVQKIVHAVKLNPELLDDITRRLELAKGKDSTSNESLKIALLEAYSLQGNASQVSSIAQSILDESPQKSSQVLDLIKKHIEGNSSSWELDEFYLDHSLRSNQTSRIFSYLKKSWKNKDKKRVILDWLEAQAKSGALPADLQIYFGKLVLEEGRSDWAIDIFQRTAATSPAEVQNIIHILDKQRHCETQVQEFCDKLRCDSQQSARDEEFDIQYFDKSEFSLSNFEKESESPRLEMDNHLYDGGITQAPPPSGAFVSDTIDVKDCADQDPPEKEESHDDPPAQIPADAPSKRAAAGRNHREIETGADNLPPAAPAKSPRKEVHVTASENERTDFAALFQDYRDGKLDNEAILSLIAAALDRGKLDEVKSLLEFRPVTMREEVRRMFFLADYYCCCDRPLSALIALRSVDPATLNQAEKRDHLTRMAASYRALKMFEAAHCAYIRLMNDAPSDPRLASLAKANYVDYMQERCDEALILEKVCFLDS